MTIMTTLPGHGTLLIGGTVNMRSIDSPGGGARATKDPPKAVTGFGALSENQLLTYTQAAVYLGITPQYLRELKAARRIRAVELGKRCIRFRVASLNRFIAERETA